MQSPQTFTATENNTEHAGLFSLAASAEFSLKKTAMNWEKRLHDTAYVFSFTQRSNIKNRGFQRDVSYLGWPIAPSRSRGELRGLSQWVPGTAVHRSPNFGYLTPYLTYDQKCWMLNRRQCNCTAPSSLNKTITFMLWLIYKYIYTRRQHPFLLLCHQIYSAEPHNPQ